MQKEEYIRTKEIKKAPPNSFLKLYYKNIGKPKKMKPKPKTKKHTINEVWDVLMELTKFTKDGFKQVNARLDYIVKANNLKDLPDSN